MLVRRGIAVSPGVAIGPALLLGSESFRIPQRFVSVDAVDAEIARFRGAVEAVCEEIQGHERQANETFGQQYGAIFAAHRQLIRDPRLIGEIEDLIGDKCFSAEFAVSRILRQYAKRFEKLADRYLSERAADLFDLQNRLLRKLLGERREELSSLTEPVLVLAHDLTPSETASLDRKFVTGFATEVGGPTSHTAILASALGLPAVVGVGSLIEDISGGESVIIDGHHGTIIIDPDDETLERYRVSKERFHSFNQRLESLRQLPSETKDGVRIRLLGNIEFPDEAEMCMQRGADGVGLYRTEFLYLEGSREPTEDDHYTAYCRVLDSVEGRPVTIRTLDFGADKMPRFMNRVHSESVNPALGMRSIRLSLRNLSLFKTQIRAILRAAVHGDIRVMFPLVTTLLELRQARMIVGDIIEDLEDQQIPFRRDVPLGMMVEVPAAAILADEFATEADFFSIGTNDLIQYTLAADRADPAVASLYQGADPSILFLVKRVVDAANRHNIPVTVCGQMSSDATYVPLLIGMGLRQLSATPNTIPELKEIIRSLTISQAEEIAQRAATFDLARDVENFLRGELAKICPDSRNSIPI